MKKRFTIFNLLLLVIVLGMFQGRAYAAEHTLEEIAETFNKSSVVASYQEAGLELYAVANADEPDMLRIVMTDAEGESSAITFSLQGSILSYDYLLGEQLIPVVILADSIGQVNGYEEGELYDTLNSDVIENYTVENEGFEIRENGSYYAVKMDIDKKVPLADLSDFYLKPEDFLFVQNVIQEGTTGNMNGKRNKMAYDITVTDEKTTIYIGEKDENTQSTYRSVLSAIEAVYNQKTLDYFVSLYPETFEGAAFYDGISVETDVAPEDNVLFDGMSVVLVTLDNEYIKDMFFRTSFIGETVDGGKKTLTLDFTEGNTYKIGFFDSVSESGDAGFLFKYILEPVFAEAGAELTDDVAYFNIVDGKIVVGDQKNSIFKIVILENDIQIQSVNPEAAKTAVTANHADVIVAEYEEGAAGAHVRYVKYQVTVNVTYGKEIVNTDGGKETTPAKNEQTDAGKNSAVPANSSPKTGDSATAARVLMAGCMMVAALMILLRSNKKISH